MYSETPGTALSWDCPSPCVTNAEEGPVASINVKKSSDDVINHLDNMENTSVYVSSGGLKFAPHALYELRKFPHHFDMDLHYRDWRQIFATSYCDDLISPHMLFGFRLFCGLLFLAVECYSTTMAALRETASSSYLIYFSVWTHILTVVFFFASTAVSYVAIRQFKSCEAANVGEQPSMATDAMQRRSRLYKLCGTLPAYEEVITDPRYTKCGVLMIPNPTSIQVIRPGSKKAPYAPWFVIITWILHNLLLSSTLLVSLVFWFGIVPVGHEFNVFLDVWKLLISFLILFFHAAISRFPHFLRHQFHFGFFALLYIVLSALVYVYDIPNFSGESGYVYNIINFKNSPVDSSIILVVVAVIGANLTYFVMWACLRNRSAFVDPPPKCSQAVTLEGCLPSA